MLKHNLRGFASVRLFEKLGDGFTVCNSNGAADGVGVVICWIDAKRGKDRCGNIARRKRGCFRIRADAVRSANDLAFPHSGSCRHDRVDSSPVLAARRASRKVRFTCHSRCAAEFALADDQCRIEESSLRKSSSRAEKQMSNRGNK